MSGRAAAVTASVVAVLAVACGGGAPSDDGTEFDPATADVTRGQELYGQHCARCHGPEGAGDTGVGPPLVHPLYVPAETPDEAFLQAVQQGASAEHWEFGAMPPLRELSPGQVAAITAYVRELQQDAGVTGP